MFALSAAGFIATSTSGWSPGVWISDDEKLIWKPDTPGSEPGDYQYTVPDDFRFTIDGKKLSVSELKAGMKGTATVTTTTSP